MELSHQAINLGLCHLKELRAIPQLVTGQLAEQHSANARLQHEGSINDPVIEYQIRPQM